MVKCAILISNPGVGKLDEDLESISRKYEILKSNPQVGKSEILISFLLRRKI